MAVCATALTAANFELKGVDPRALRRGVGGGRYVRIKKGAYVPSEIWAAMSELERHVALIHAVAESNPDAVFSHWSAAALRGLPVFGRWPSDAHAIDQRASGGRSEPYLRVHCVGYHEDEVVDGTDGVRLTSVVRTAIDLGAGASFETAVMMMDAALHRGLLTSAELAERLTTAKPHRGGRALVRAARFADAAAESPGESLSRVRIEQLGFPPPQLQVPRHRRNGSSERPDFGAAGRHDVLARLPRAEPS